MKNPSSLLPLKFGTFITIKKLTWHDFKGQVNQNLPWSAHIFWSIDYVITNYQKKTIQVNLRINKNSWVRLQRKCNHLLNHQQGHYLIGALCCLQFLRRVDKKKKHSNKKFQDLVFQTFDRTIKEYLILEKKYDEQTQHRLNYKKQQFWDEFIYDRLTYFMQIFDQTKNKFVNLGQIQKNKKPEKQKQKEKEKVK